MDQELIPMDEDQTVIKPISEQDCDQDDIGPGEAVKGMNDTIAEEADSELMFDKATAEMMFDKAKTDGLKKSILESAW